MTILRDIKLARAEELETRAEKALRFPATIVKVGTSISPPNRSMYVYVVEQGIRANVIAVLNLTVSAIEGLEVWVEKSNDGELQIVGIYTASIDQNSDSGANFNLPLHSANHQYRTEDNIGIDPLVVYAPSIGILKTTDNADLSVNILEYRYIYNRISYYFTGEVLDLSTYVPLTANRQVVLLIYLDVIYNTINILSGIETNTILPLNYPTIPDDAVPSSYVKLVTGQTTITLLDGDIIDTRDFLQINTTLQVPEPVVVGDMLISHDGISWSRGLPISDIFGELILSNDGVVITT